MNCELVTTAVAEDAELVVETAAELDSITLRLVEARVGFTVVLEELPMLLPF